MKRARLWKNVILWAISRREISPLVVIFKKKIDQPSWRTTQRNYKHTPQIVCISSRFRVLLHSWEFEWSKILWKYTVILVCHLKHAEVGWSTRNYPHTGHLSWTWSLSRWRDAVFLREVSVGCFKEDEKWMFFLYVSRFPRILK